MVSCENTSVAREYHGSFYTECPCGMFLENGEILCHVKCACGEILPR